MTADMKPCLTCKGKGKRLTDSFTHNGQFYPARSYDCLTCQGVGEFGPPDQVAILKAIVGRKGLRSKRPEPPREYYVWRWARFHGGTDVTMPVMATLEVRGDPYQSDLERIAGDIARHVYGTDRAGAHRWGRVLGVLKQDTRGLPASAYEGGPVADGDKPEEEAAELQ